MFCFLAASINFQHHFFLFLSCLENGNIELGVHIADVAHFVKPGSLTDQEAKSRSTTVYLADRRYDMLPSILSANLCSLVSGVDRYAFFFIKTVERLGCSQS